MNSRYNELLWVPLKVRYTRSSLYFHMWSACLMVITSSSGDVMSIGEISHLSWKLIGVTFRQITIELDWYKLKSWIKFSLFLSRYRLCGRRMIWNSRTLVPIWRARLFQYKDAYKRTCWWCLALDHVNQKHPYRFYLNTPILSQGWQFVKKHVSKIFYPLVLYCDHLLGKFLLHLRINRYR